ncbi:MAG: ATP-binding protein, partial [Candidatus Promineifilaceae bacterium]
FPGRMRALYLLVIIFVSVLFSLVSTPLLQLPLGLLVPILFMLLLGISLFWSLPSPLQTTLRRIALPGIIREKELVQFNLDIQGNYDLETLPLQIVQSLETHLELSFAALWLAHEPEIGILETYTDNAPAQHFPAELPLQTIWQYGVQRLTSGVLTDTGCEIALFLAVKEQKVGILGLGPRWTEDVFDATDLQTLAVIAQQAALALNTAQQMRALSHVPLQMEQAQLRERERIAQDLHDSTQARLTQLLFALEKIRGQIGVDPALAELRVDTAVSDVNQTALELRAILQNLLPQRRGSHTFIESLNEYLDRQKRLHPEVQIYIDAETGIDDVLSENDQLGLLRVCQQAIDNALQHGHPTAISLLFQMHLEKQQLSFAISDNGRGLVWGTSADLLAQGHHGLHIMEARVQQQGGQLHVQSAPDEGTTILGYIQLRTL